MAADRRFEWMWMRSQCRWLTEHRAKQLKWNAESISWLRDVFSRIKISFCVIFVASVGFVLRVTCCCCSIVMRQSSFLFSQNEKETDWAFHQHFTFGITSGSGQLRMLSPESVLRLRGNTFKPLDSPIADSVPKITNSIGSHSTENLLSISARRRFSNVSDVVSRKLSNTIGWKIPTPSPVPTQDIVTQGKCLCGQYIRYRLKRSGVFNKRLALQRIRSIIGTPSVHIVREVFPALNYVRDTVSLFILPFWRTYISMNTMPIAGGRRTGAYASEIIFGRRTAIVPIEWRWIAVGWIGSRHIGHRLAGSLSSGYHVV